jgi:hypothetical protein
MAIAFTGRANAAPMNMESRRLRLILFFASVIENAHADIISSAQFKQGQHQTALVTALGSGNRARLQRDQGGSSEDAVRRTSPTTYCQNGVPVHAL